MWGHDGERSGSPNRGPSRSSSRSREGSPLKKSLTDLVLSAVVQAAAGVKTRSSFGELVDKQEPPPTPTAPLRNTPPADTPAVEEVPHITFTFFEPKDKDQSPAAALASVPATLPDVEDSEEAEEVTPDEEWLDDVQQEKEVTETTFATPQRISVAMTSDCDDDFVDARGSSDSNSQSPSPAPAVVALAALAPRQVADEEPEYVCVQRPGLGPGRDEEASSSPEREVTPAVVCNPIYRSPSYSHAVHEGVYSCPRPQGAPPPPPVPSSPPPSVPPPVPDPDWTSTDSGSNQVSEYATYYVPNGDTSCVEKCADPSKPPGHQDYEEVEYCAAGPLPREPLPRVRSKLRRAWRVMRGWWGEERARLGDTLMRHVHAQAVGAFHKPERPERPASCDQLDHHEDDFDDDEEFEQAEAAPRPEGDPKEDPMGDPKGEEEGCGLSKRTISAPSLPRVLVLRRRKDSDEASSVSTAMSTAMSTWSRPGSRAALRRSKYMPEVSVESLSCAV